MPTINVGYTAPINPASASPILTLPQIWAGLERKVRRAQEFVSVITSCDVESEEVDPKSGNKVITRRAQFGTGLGHESKDNRLVREVCTLHPPARVDFLQEDGTLIGNYVTDGQDGGLWMTYVFEWRVDDGVEGEELEKAREKFRGGAKIAVEKTIETIRRMVKDGEL